MEKTVQEITGKQKSPYFLQPVLAESELTGFLRALHLMITEEEKTPEKKNCTYF